MNIQKYFNFFGILFIIFFTLLILDSFMREFGLMLYKQSPNFILTYFKNFYYFGPDIASLNNGQIVDYAKVDNKLVQIIWFENGIVEHLQIIFLFITIIILAKIFFALKKREKIISLFIILKIFGLTYFFLEEISYGQHFLNFETPEKLTEINKQKEFNLHNISNIFNEFPRAMVKIWCGFSIILIFILKTKINKIFINLIKPDKKLFIISCFIILFVLPDFVVSKFGLIDYSKLYFKLDYPMAPMFETCGYLVNCNIISYNPSQFYTILLSFNFFRLSELQEFLFCYYFFWHALFLKNILLNEKNRPHYN